IEPGQLAVPPESKVTDTDWDEAGNHKKQAEPEDKATSTTEAQTDTEMSNTELDRIRRQLEGLL
ncbi:MAG: hypothetical protein WBB82_03565, partial [Limnothrix sp.]